jgi:hypothetical protein
MASEANERLDTAAMRDDVAGIDTALLAGADPNAFVFGWSPLQHAAFGGHIVAIAALLAAGARVDGGSTYGATPLMWAAANGHTAAIDALVAAGANVHLADKFGNTALHRASMGGHPDAARVLLEAGARADVRNKNGQTPIDWVRGPTCSLADLMRLRVGVTLLRRRVAVRRFGGTTSPPRPPCAPCAPPLPPGPAAAP